MYSRLLGTVVSRLSNSKPTRTFTCPYKVSTTALELHGITSAVSSSISDVFPDESSLRISPYYFSSLRPSMYIPRRTLCCITSRQKLTGRCLVLTSDGAMESASCSGSGPREMCKCSKQVSFAVALIRVHPSESTAKLTFIFPAMLPEGAARLSSARGGTRCDRPPAGLREGWSGHRPTGFWRTDRSWNVSPGPALLSSHDGISWR